MSQSIFKNKIMTHSDIIIILITGGIASTLGVYALIRKINHYTSPPVNTLTRQGDIELANYIQPTQNHVDLLAPQPTYGRFPSL
jgi:hypothetical protein